MSYYIVLRFTATHTATLDIITNFREKTVTLCRMLGYISFCRDTYTIPHRKLHVLMVGCLSPVNGDLAWVPYSYSQNFK